MRSRSSARGRNRTAKETNSEPDDRQVPTGATPADVHLPSRPEKDFIDHVKHVSTDFFVILFWQLLCARVGFLEEYSKPASHALSSLANLAIHCAVTWAFNTRKPVKELLRAAVQSLFIVAILLSMLTYNLGLHFAAWMGEPSVWDGPLTQFAVMWNTAVSGNIVPCPAKTVSHFMELPEQKRFTEIFAAKEMNKMVLLRGVSDSGKSTTLRQAICNVGAQHEAIYIGMRDGQTSNVIFSYDELCKVFEEALQHLAVPRPPPDSRGLQRFRHIISNIKKYQKHVRHRIVVVDDLHALQGMGPDAADAIKLITETLIWVLKECGTRVVMTSSDGLFLDELERVLGKRPRQVVMGDVPISECMKHAQQAEHRALLEAALSRTGTSLETCIDFQNGPVDEVEARIVGEVCHKLHRNRFACNAVLNPPHAHSFSEWDLLRKINMAELTLTSTKMLDVYLMPAVKEFCSAMLSGALENPSIVSGDEEGET